MISPKFIKPSTQLCNNSIRDHEKSYNIKSICIYSKNYPQLDFFPVIPNKFRNKTEYIIQSIFLRELKRMWNFSIYKLLWVVKRWCVEGEGIFPLFDCLKFGHFWLSKRKLIETVSRFSCLRFLFSFPSPFSFPVSGSSPPLFWRRSPLWSPLGNWIYFLSILTLIQATILQ